MNIFRLHGRADRARAPAIGMARQRSAATRARSELENAGPAAGHGMISVNPHIVSHGREDWRQRLLAARGEQIHIGSVQRNDRCAIAILDATGIVISWRDNLPRARPYDPDVLSRHVSQFYLPNDVALHVPARHLSIAAEYGVDTQRGWRRRPAGEIFWGVTIVQSILLSDGEVLGYSHVTRSLRAPVQHLSRALRAGLTQTAGLAAMA